MKNPRHLATALFALVATAATLAAKPLAGPRGGRILTTDAPHAEFFVEKDRSVVISFYDAALKPVPLSGQVVTAVAEAKGGKVNLNFAAKNGALVSTGRLPEGDNYNVVIQIRDNASARPKNYRVLLQEEICAGCNRAEYACTCDDAGKGPDHDHDRKKKG